MARSKKEKETPQEEEASLPRKLWRIQRKEQNGRVDLVLFFGTLGAPLRPVGEVKLPQAEAALLLELLERGAKALSDEVLVEV